MTAGARARRPVATLGLALVTMVAAGPTGGCKTENGRGFVTGMLNVPGCTFPDRKPRPLDNEAMFEGHWNHFLGEPFDSSTPRFPANQINIRMQSDSGGWEFADALFFWVYDSYEIARCMRGRMNDDGSPDWNTAACDRTVGSLGPSGEGRLFIGTEGELVTSHFVLQNSCPGAEISAGALGTCALGTCPPVALCPGRNSWISFTRFGAPPADPTARLDPDFKVNKDDPIEASAFHVELCDQSTIDDVLINEVIPIPTPAITGTLDGNFSFNLQPNFR